MASCHCRFKPIAIGIGIGIGSYEPLYPERSIMIAITFGLPLESQEKRKANSRIGRADRLKRFSLPTITVAVDRGCSRFDCDTDSDPDSDRQGETTALRSDPARQAWLFRTPITARMKAGRSSGVRLVTSRPSTTTSRSTQLPPALTMSSLMEK